MSRILKDTGATIKTTFYEDGVATDADGAVTVTLTRADGTVSVSAATATSEGAGVYSYQVSPSLTDALELFTADWSGTFSAVVQTVSNEVEVVGRHLFGLAEARAFRYGTQGDTPLSDTTVYSNDQVIEARDRVTDRFADFIGYSPVPRFRRVTCDGVYSTELDVPDWPVTECLAAVIAGADVTDDVTAYDGWLYRAAGWYTAVRRGVAVCYVHGLERHDYSLSRAALIATVYELQSSSADPRALSLSSEFGTTQFSTADGNRRAYGIPEVDAALTEARRRHIAVA